MSSSRQLAAIMFTDIVGYTALMGRDSDKALELIRISKEIQKPLVEKHYGKWLKEMGDGAMAQFSTALDAVNCSIEIQKAARGELDAKLRIGIHSGDITIENDDVYGDGVNVASRLESIADPGGIYVSDAIEKAIQGQTDVQAKYLGEVKLKNVAYGVRTYALQGVGLPVPEVKDEKELSGHLTAELQRRGVIRAGVVYLGVALILILLLREGQDWLTVPEWSTTALLIVLIVGFPIALYLAWNYERSPEGFVRTSSKESWQNPYKGSQKKPLTSNVIIAVMALIIVGMYVYPKFQSNLSEDNELEVAVTIDNKTLAVIPFVDMSQEGDQEWFSDGMMDEILNHLVQIEDLKVTSRTSAMRFKGSEKSLQEIGKELNVAHILEGSVRKQGNKVRITVQLIDVESDQHIWSNTYDRNLDDVFAIQSEVAQRVATELQAQVHPEVRIRIESQPTANIEAYGLYLEAVFQYNTFTYEGFQQAEKLFEQVLEIDPEFADAYAYLGSLRSSFTWFGADQSNISSPKEAVQIALPYYEKALEIEPDNLNAHKFLAYMYLWYEWDFEKAQKEYETVLRLNPNYGWTDFLIASGNFEEAVARTEELIRLDPLNMIVSSEMAMSLYFNNQPQNALEAVDLVRKSAIANSHVGIGRVCLYLGKYERTIEILEPLQKDIPVPRVLGTLAIAYHHIGERDESDDLLQKIITISKETSAGSPSFYLAMIHAQMGEIETAFEWLDKAYEDHEVEMYWLKVEPPFEPLHDDPRWQEMLDKVGFPD